MLARIQKSVREKDAGFTLIELLVVMIIIGILAAIAIPVFLNQRASARLTSAKADASVIGKEFAAYYVDGISQIGVTGSGGTFTVATTAATPATVTTGTLSPGNSVTASSSTTAGKYCAVVRTSEAGDGYVLVTSTGVTAKPKESPVTTCTAA